MITELDKSYIKRALKLAKQGMGSVSPNPMVGAVIVKDSIILGEGYHIKYGEAHAEPNAINSAIESVEGATLYCTLEPCCHTNKQTPPCTNAIINSKISRVVILNLDPNPYVAGKGVEVLKEAGIEVDVLDCELVKEGKKLNEVFFKHIKTKMPFICIKAAQTLDGKISTMSGDSKWISDEAARTQVHEMRLHYDAVMVGRSTVNNDNPSLNIRMGVESKGKVPYRVVLGAIQNLDFTSTIFTDDFTEKTIIITSIEDYQKADQKKIDLIKTNKINVVFASIKEDSIDLKEAFEKLNEYRITSVLVEGGSKLISSLISSELYDKLNIFICPKLAGNGIPFFNQEELRTMGDAINLNNVSYEVVNNQVLLTSYRMDL